MFAAYYLHFAETEDPGLKLAVFSTGPAIRNTAANLVTEIIGTFVLVFGVLAIIAAENWPTASRQSSGLAPCWSGSSCSPSACRSAARPDTRSIPARDLGPRIMHAILPIPGKGPSDWGYSWIPVVGPLIGGAHRRARLRRVLSRSARGEQP